MARASVERELARARGARRLIPWAMLSSLAGAAIGLFAGGGPRAAAALFLLGSLFAAFLFATSTPRCPSCGARLPGRGPAPVACPRCRVPYEAPRS